MTISVIISVDQNVIQIYNDKNVKFLGKNLDDISLEAYWYVCQTKKHHLILKVTLLGPECGFPLVFFADFHSMVGTSELELSQLFSSS